MLTFDTTISGLNTNSYLTLLEAETIASGHQYGIQWPSSVATQQRLLVAATNRLDEERYAGASTTDTQALLFPRSSFIDRNGDELSNQTYPIEFKKAVFELALHYARQAKNEIAVDNDSTIYESKSESLDGLGSVSVTYKQKVNENDLPAKVKSLLKAMSSANGWLNGSNIKLVR